MKSKTVAALNFSEQRSIVNAVVLTYISNKQKQPMSCLNPDPEQPNHTERWKPEAVHYVRDIERAVESVLDANPNDRPTLLTAWRNLLKTRTSQRRVEFHHG